MTTTARAASRRSPPICDHGDGLAIVTEGLLGLPPTDAVRGLWRRFARTLDGFPAGLYISDLHLGGAVTPPVRAFRLALSAFVRGRVYLHFSDAAEAERELVAAGFRVAERPPGRGRHGRRSSPGKPTR